MCLQQYLVVTCKETDAEDPPKMHHICALGFQQCPKAQDLKLEAGQPCSYEDIKIEQMNAKVDSKYRNPNGLRKDCPVCNDKPVYRNLGSIHQMPDG